MTDDVAEFGENSDQNAARKEQRKNNATGVGMALTSSLSAQFGAGIGALSFPVLGPVGVVAIRQMFAAAFFMLFARPNWRAMTRSQWLPVVGLAICFSLISICLYFAIERIGLGLAITIEFLGPLGVAVATSRRVLDVLSVLVAASGVVLLVNPGPTSDILGIGLALLSAIGWAAYIFLNRQLGRKMRGVQGTAAASVLSAGIWIPIGIAWFIFHPPTFLAVVLAVICGFMSSVVPFAVDVLALKRIDPSLYSTLASLHPVWAAVAGILLLDQWLTVAGWIGLGLVVLANIAVTSASVLRAPRIAR